MAVRLDLSTHGVRPVFLGSTLLAYADPDSVRLGAGILAAGPRSPRSAERPGAGLIEVRAEIPASPVECFDERALGTLPVGAAGDRFP